MRKLTDGTSILQEKISDINWNEVYYFSLVATYGSMKRAAEVLRLSPSTLSEHISQLESQLKVELFHRRGPKIELTEQGNRLFLHAKGMFEHSQRLLDAVSPLHLGSYPISVGFIPGPHLPLAYKWVAMFENEFGPINMKLQHCLPDNLETSLIKGRLDFGFSNKAPERDDLLYEKIAQEPICFYVSAKWFDFRLADLLERIPLLMCRTEASTETFVEHALRKVDLIPSSTVISDFPSVLVDLCIQGLGVGAFCEEPILTMNSRSLRSLRSPKDAPKIESELYVIWAAAGEQTESIAHLKALISKQKSKGKFKAGRRWHDDRPST